jgi:methanogenic corrinoid protein MtbC1
MVLDKQHPTPVYMQLKTMLQSQIEQGSYVSHQKLPSERDLCQHYDLSRMTVRRALQQLVAEGFAYTRAGKGTFVGQIPGNGLNGSHKNGQPDILVSGIPDYRWQSLVTPLLSFDCVGVEQAIREALAVHPLEIIAGKIFPEIIKYFEQQWRQGEISLLAHNYAITTLHAQLVSMMNAATMPEYGPKVLLGCTPGDTHEIGLLLLALLLRRRGFQVIYLGSNLTAAEFREMVDQAQPQLVCLSAATEQSITNLKSLAGQLTDNLGQSEKIVNQRTILAFGGVSFSQKPYLVEDVPGIYLGNTIDMALTKILALCNTPNL